ncbi:MAG: O-methyltransferase [Clostridia bacterium]
MEIKAFLEELEQDARVRFIPVILDDSAKILIETLNEINAKSILEIGTAIGYSGIMMLDARKNATLDTIEINSERYAEAQNNFAKAQVSARVNSFLGDSSNVLQQLKQNKYDFIFLDGAKSDYKTYLPILIDMLTENGVIFADNVFFKGMVLNDVVPRHKVRTMVVNLRQFIKLAQNTQLYNTVFLEAGDGIALIKKATK